MAQTKNLTWNELKDLGFTVTKDKRTGAKRIDFKAPPKGKKFVPLETNQEDIKLRELDRRFVTMHRFSATSKLVVMDLVDEQDAEVADAYVACIKDECKSMERKNRCKIRSPKTGKEIYCPESVSCYSSSCPMKQGKSVEKDIPASLEMMAETVKSSIYSDNPTADAAITDEMWDCFKKVLRKESFVLADIVEWDEYGYNRDEILRKMKRKDTDKSWYYYQWKRIRTRWIEYSKE